MVSCNYMKKKRIHFLKPQISSRNDEFGGIKFEDILDEIINLDNASRVVEYDGIGLGIAVDKIGLKYVISIDKVDSNDSPVIKDMASNKIRNIDLADNEGILYDNIFVYDPERNLLAFVILGTGHPRQNMLKSVVNSLILKNELFSNIEPKVSRFNVELRNDGYFNDKIRKGKKLTTVKFVSENFNQVDNIGNSQKTAYDDFLSGRDYRKTTILSGFRGSDIRGVMGFFVQDLINNAEIPEFKNITITIDGEEISLYNQIKYMQKDFKESGKQLDKVFLKKTLVEAIDEYV